MDTTHFFLEEAGLASEIKSDEAKKMKNKRSESSIASRSSSFKLQPPPRYVRYSLLCNTSYLGTA